MTEQPVSERFDQLLREAQAIAVEAKVYRGDRQPGEVLAMAELSSTLYASVYDTARRWGYSHEELADPERCTEIDAVAVGKVGTR